MCSCFNLALELIVCEYTFFIWHNIGKIENITGLKSELYINNQCLLKLQNSVNYMIFILNHDFIYIY